MKKGLITFLVLAMVFMAIPAIGVAESDEVVVFTTNLFGQALDYDEGIMATYLREHLKVAFQYVDTSERKTAMMASGDIPDLMVIEGSERMDLIKSGFVLALDDLIAKHGQHIFANEDVYNYCKTSQGDGTHIYALPSFVDGSKSLAAGSIYFTVDWERYAQLGYPELEATPESLFQVIRDMVALKPNTDDGLKVYGTCYPVWDAWGLIHMGPNPLGETWLNDYVFQDAMTGELVAAYIDPESAIWENIRLMWMLNKEGLLDPDSLMGDNSANSIKCANGQYVASFFHEITNAANAIYAQAGQAKGFVSVPIKNSCADAGEDASYGSLNSRVISANCKNPELLMQVIDFMFTTEGGRIMSSGLEDVTYDYVDGVPTLRADAIKAYETDLVELYKMGIGWSNIGIAGNEICADGYKVNLFEEDAYRSLSVAPVQQAADEYYGMTSRALFTEKILGGYMGSRLMLNGRAYSVISALPDEYSLVLSNAQSYLAEAGIQCTLAESEEAFIAQRDMAINSLKAAGMDQVYDWFFTQYEAAVELYK